MPASTRRTLAVALLATTLVLTGCSDSDGDGDADADPVAAAEQRVAEAEDDLDDATAALDEASTQLCEGSAEYVEAVDQYGGLLTDAEATVGAVTAAGADLEEPREEVTASIDEVHQAQEALEDAGEALADAQASLDEARTGSTAAPTSTTTTAPQVSAGTVDRVEQAEDDLDDAFADIDPETPLSDATEAVNAAAFAVQVAWTQLLAEAGCLADQQAEVVTAVESYTRSLQTALATAGYLEGEVDGVYGPTTVTAVEQLQTDSGLPVTGLVDRATAEALDDAVVAAGGDAASTELAHVAALQTVLTVTGYWTGPIDGEWSDALTAALESLQSDLGVEPTGEVDAATVAAAQAALEEARTPTETTTTTESEPSTTSTTSP